MMLQGNTKILLVDYSDQGNNILSGSGGGIRTPDQLINRPRYFSVTNSEQRFRAKVSHL